MSDKVIKKDLGTFKVFRFKKHPIVQKAAGKSGPVTKIRLKENTLNRKSLIATSILALVLSIPLFGAQPNTPPGQDPCSHGNSNQPCRPDSQPSHGKDCLLHGNNGGENEDHCLSTPTPSPTPTPVVSPTPTPSPTPVIVPTPTPIATPTPTPEATPEPTPTPVVLPPDFELPQTDTE